MVSGDTGALAGLVIDQLGNGTVLPRENLFSSAYQLLLQEQLHETFGPAIAQGIRHGLPDACENKLLIDLGTLETDQDLPLSTHHGSRRL
jgi:hypothetical protein